MNEKLTAKQVGFAEGCEFWQIGDEIYRCSTPIMLDVWGLPSARRWECSVQHWKRYCESVYDWVTQIAQ